MKDIIALILYQWVYWLVRCIPTRAQSKHLILVKTDEIGDYMLMRNLLVYFKKSEVYKDYKITLVGNSIFKQVFEACDASTVDNTIWINKKKFRKNFFYRFARLKEIRKSGASVAINFVYSRRFRMDDVIVKVSGAGTTIGMQTDNRILPPLERWLTPRRIYTQLLDGGKETLFDGYRNARFTEKILNTNIPSISTKVPVTTGTEAFLLPPAYFVVFPGSGLKIKKWPAASFAAVAHYVVKKYDLTPVVCGAEGDRQDCEEFIGVFGEPVIDLTGKTSLPQFLAILKNAACIISVDTGSVHLAAAVGCPVFALFSGVYYGRFAPYPKEVAPDFFPVYPDRIDEIIAAGANIDFQLLPPDALNNIPPKKLIDTINRALPGLYGNKYPVRHTNN